MKNMKLINAVKEIDDELICEAMKRRSTETEQIGEKAEVISVSGTRRGQLWKYPVTAAALLGVMGGALFVINYTNVVKDNIGSSDYSAGTGDVTEKTEKSVAASNTDGSPSENEIAQVTPIKVVDIHDVEAYNYTLFQVLCVDSLPTIPNPALGKECFTKMSTEELFKYYGLEFMLPYLNDNYIETVDENTIHGIYTSSDGDVEDVNTFVFSTKGKPLLDAIYDCNKLTVTIGKSVHFGQEYDFGYTPFAHDKIFYNEESDTFFVVYNVKGNCSVMVSGKSNELVKYTEASEYLVKHILEHNNGISPSVYSIKNAIYNLFTTSKQVIGGDQIDEEMERDPNPETWSPWFEYIDEVTGEKKYE